MESIQDMLRRFYGYVSYDGRRNKYEKRARSKHQASKRGYVHRRRLSLGERNHVKYLSTWKG